MDIRFDGKTAIVTGAGSGLGAVIALELAASGAKVIVADLNGDAAKSTADRIIASGGEAVPAIADVSDATAVERLIATAMENGRLHLLVNNAGIGGPNAPVGETPIDAWKQVIDINLNAVFFGMRFGIPAMQKSGGGAIVNMASVLGTVGSPGNVGYATAKHAVIGMTKNAALDYATAGVRVNAVAPAFIDTPLLKQLEDDKRESLVGMHPMGRLGKAEEVSGLVLFLLSERASFITGSTHLVDGGYTAR